MLPTCAARPRLNPTNTALHTQLAGNKLNEQVVCVVTPKATILPRILEERKKVFDLSPHVWTGAN